jgi:succinate-acetate transporter protein
MFNASLAYGAAEFLDDNTAKALFYAGYVGLMTGPPLLVSGLTLTVGTAILRHGVFPKWLAWLSLLIALLGVLSVFGLLMDDQENVLSMLGALAFLLWAVWTLALSFYMLKAEAVPEPDVVAVQTGGRATPPAGRNASMKRARNPRQDHRPECHASTSEYKP